MRKIGLVKDKVRRAIAVASVFMLTCSVGTGNIGAGTMTSYGQEMENSGDEDGSGSDEGSDSSR